MIHTADQDMIFSIMKEYQAMNVENTQCDIVRSYDDMDVDEQDRIEDISGYRGFTEELAIKAVNERGFEHDQGEYPPFRYTYLHIKMHLHLVGCTQLTYPKSYILRYNAYGFDVMAQVIGFHYDPFQVMLCKKSFPRRRQLIAGLKKWKCDHKYLDVYEEWLSEYLCKVEQQKAEEYKRAERDSTAIVNMIFQQQPE